MLKQHVIIKLIYIKIFIHLDHRVICWAHVKRAIDKQLNELKNKQASLTIKNDIIQFQHYVKEDILVSITRLMITDWRTNFPSRETEEFIKYFNKQWLIPKRNGWYDHYCDYCPCTNNALESINRYVKENGTLRERLGILQFLNVLEKGFLKA